MTVYRKRKWSIGSIGTLFMSQTNQVFDENSLFQNDHVQQFKHVFATRKKLPAECLHSSKKGCKHIPESN